MSVNNLCDTLIVYGSFAPGGSNHHLLSDLPGKWVKGKILKTLVSEPDEIGPGEVDIIEAWTITFTDCQAEMFTPEWDSKKRHLHERWMNLDEIMGKQFERSQERWWPEGGQPVVAENGMIVVNIYLPIKHFPYLQNQDDVPSPDEEEEIIEMWHDVRTGKKKYDWSCFMGFINDITPDQYEELFGQLPMGDKFIAKLNSFFNVNKTDCDNLTHHKDGSFSLYVVPQSRKFSVEEFIGLIKKELEQFQMILSEEGYNEDAELLKGLNYIASRPPEGKEPSDEVEDALLTAGGVLGDNCGVDEHWQYCLDEACYTISCSFELRNWLMSHWYDCPFEYDFEPSYLIWQSGYEYKIIGQNCYVFPE